MVAAHYPACFLIIIKLQYRLAVIINRVYGEFWYEDGVKDDEEVYLNIKI